VAVEQQLLKALGREPRGKLTATGTSPESSLSVEEAERMLPWLAAKGYLEVTVEHGRLYYAFGSARLLHKGVGALAYASSLKTYSSACVEGSFSNVCKAPDQQQEYGPSMVRRVNA
jgi:hypothetical protein